MMKVRLDLMEVADGRAVAGFNISFVKPSGSASTHRFCTK